ncbi:hypothetical protein P3U41_05365 [Mammaliicoccus sciuri]|uniref:hypothetical protein n=1 Tax=Mammaliicoccus TaxID=2803850 RepID=UPI001EFB4ED2|nr:MULTISPECIES: hypothetical protein [Mammaliicoccus]WQL34198.1 hypothetical protein P3U41_05365 [Mammaliicoccus sciuri]WQL61137.1 hypothetical protein P3T96_05365 [Mammaliicoccus sciuri]
MDTSIHVVGAVENVTEEIKSIFNNLIDVNEVILMVRTDSDCKTIKITDIIDIGVLEPEKTATRALQIIK